VDRDVITAELGRLTQEDDHSDEPATVPARLGARTAGDPEILGALGQITEALAACYRQALRDIAQPDRESFVGPAAALRELLSFVLRDLAPDAALSNEPWFKAETNDGRPTRAQRVRYIMKKRAGISNEKVNRALEGLDRIVCDTYDRASRATHLGQGGRTEIATLADYVHGILRDLLLG